MANAFLLLAHGLEVEDVAELLHLDEAILTGWQQMFAASKPLATSL